jgi:hypothetical protein
LKKILVVSFLLCLLSLLAGAGALILAEFGAPVWVFVLLLGWLVTVGLPTTSAVLLMVRFWEGPSFQAFLLSATVLAFAFQFGAISLVWWGIKRVRSRKQYAT